MPSSPEAHSATLSEDAQRTRFHRIRRIATGLLVLMMAIYALARTFHNDHTAWPWVRAFAEAGMVGALADWFAVTALFRRPLGLPIPHTAIVSEQKDRIGNSLAKFVRGNFLTPEVLGSQMRRLRPVQRALAWFGKKENADHVWQFLGNQMSENANIFNEEEMRVWVKKLATTTCTKLESTPVEVRVGKWMAESMNGPEFRGVVAPLFGKLANTVAESRDWVESEAGQRAPLQETRLIARLTRSVTEAVSGRMIGQLSVQLTEASHNIEHPFYEKLEKALQELGAELQEGDTGHGEWSAWRQRVFASEGLRETLEGFLFSVGEFVIKERGALFEKIGQELSSTAARLAEDEAALSGLEAKGVSTIMTLSEHYGDEFEKLVRQTVEAWEAETLIEKLEASVGADLQFIRINGTLIGGIIGLLLHGLGLIIWGV